MPTQEKKPVSARPAKGLFLCPFLSKKIDQKECAGITSNKLENMRVCTKYECQCPWRMCRICVSQKYAGEDRCVADAKEGLCAFHLEHGIEAYRKGTRQPGEPLPASVDLIERVEKAEERMVFFREKNDEMHKANGDQLILCSDIRRFKDQPRVHFDKDELVALAESIKVGGLLRTILVKRLKPGESHKYELIDGERRWRAHQLVGIEHIWAQFGNPSDKAHQHFMSVVSNLNRAGHTDLEMADALQFQKEHGGLTNKQLAVMSGHGEGWVKQHLSILKLDPKVRAMMELSVPESRRLVYSKALTLTGLPAPKQIELAEEAIRKNLRIHELQHRVAVVATKEGIQNLGPGRKRRPVDERENFLRFFESFIKNGRLRLEGRMGDIEKIFTACDEKDLHRIINLAEEAEEIMQKFLTRFEKVAKKRKISE